jgi:hypothetical protein
MEAAREGAPARAAERIWAIVTGFVVTITWLGAIAYAVDFIADRL